MFDFFYKRIRLTIGIIVFVTSVLISNHTYAYESNIQFDNITISDGLAQSTVEAIYQDSKGYIWIGTNDGLNRFNGYDFKVYKYGEDPKTSIASNYVLSIKEDNYGDIWIGTISGVSKISSDGLKITNYYEGKYNGNLSSSNGADILITSNGQVLVATEEGLNLYDKKNDKFNRILDGKDSLTSQDIYSLAEDENGDIWIGTYDGLNKVDVKNKKIQHFYSSEDENSISENSIYKVYSDKKGYIWVGTENQGLNKINIKTNDITRYKNINGNQSSLQGNFVTNILRDKSGTLWICTDEGLSKYIEEDDSFITYKNILYDRYSLINNQTFGIIQDNSGLIWVGTYAGISIFDPDNKVKHYKNVPGDNKSLSDNVVHGLYEDDEGYIWIGTKSSGLNIMKRNDLSYNQSEIITYLTKKNGLSDNSINFITGDNSTIWVATSDGLNKIDKKSKKIKIYNQNDGLLNSNIKTLMLDSKGYLWIGLSNGVNILDTNTDNIINLNNIFDKYNIEDRYIKAIYEEEDGSYLLGTFKEGQIIKLNSNGKEITEYTNKEEALGTSTIYSFAEDDNYIWIGTSYGLKRIDKKNKNYKKYTEKDGLSNNNVYSVVIDNRGKLWMSTNYGVSVLDPENERFINYNITDGFQSNEFNSGSYFKNNNGDIMFGGINGFNLFNPLDMVRENSDKKVVFEELKINNTSYNDIKKLNLNYSDSLSIKFFFPDYTDIKNTKYYYKMDGIDDRWIYDDSNKIVYSNLDSGNYTFRVKAVDHNGVMSEESSFKFKVNPHILFSPVACLFYIITIIIFIYLNRTKVKRLDKLVKYRTIELNNEMHKNKELFDKVIELERNKNNYFVNLSHELRTPLNVISSTQQLLLEFNKRKEYIEKDRLEYHLNVMKSNTKRLLNLINNIIDTAKVDHGNYHINLKYEDIVFIVEETALDMKDYIEASEIELVIDTDIEEKIIQCDRTEIERCIVNLIDNARKFTPKGGKIEVKIEDLDDKVKISISDTGCGIDIESQKYIFDRFNQVIDKDSESKGGSGLGLTITKHIIDIHNGKIYVESEVQKGCTFTMILPVEVK